MRQNRFKTGQFATKRRVAEERREWQRRAITFLFSLPRTNEAIIEKLEIYNQKNNQLLDEIRQLLFEQLDLALLRPLPKRRYEYVEWSSPKVNIDDNVKLMKPKVDNIYLNYA